MAEDMVEKEAMEDGDSLNFNPRKFAVDGMIMDCFDILLEADDLDEFRANVEVQEVDDVDFQGIEEYTICRGLFMMDIHPDEPCYGRILAKLSGPLRKAVAQRDASPEDRKIQFLEMADLGFQRDEEDERLPTFTYRGHKMTMFCLKVDMIITHFQLSVLCRYRFASYEEKEGDKFKQAKQTSPASASGAGPSAESRNKLQRTSLHDLIHLNKQAVLKLCQDDGLHIPTDSSTARVFAAAIMRAVKADELVGPTSTVQERLEKAMPPSGWTSLMKLNNYGKEAFVEWSDLSHSVDCVFRILQGLLLVEGIRTVPNSFGHLVSVDQQPTQAIRQSFQSLLNWTAKKEPGWNNANYEWKWVDQNLAAFGIYFGQPLFQAMDERLRRAIGKSSITSPRHKNDTTNLCYKQLALGRAVTSRVIKSRTYRVTYLCPWELILVTSHTVNPGVLPCDFVLEFWMLQNIGHAHRVGRRQRQEQGGKEDEVSDAVEGQPEGPSGPAQESSLQGLSAEDLSAKKSSAQDLSTHHTDLNNSMNDHAGIPLGAHHTAPQTMVPSTEPLEEENPIADLAGLDVVNEQERLLTHDSTAVDDPHSQTQVPSTAATRNTTWAAINSPKGRGVKTPPTPRRTKTSPTGVSKPKGKKQTPKTLSRAIHNYFSVMKNQITTGHDGKSASTIGDEDNQEDEIGPAASRHESRSVFDPREDEEGSGSTGDTRKASIYLPPVDMESVSSTPADWTLSNFAHLSLTFHAGGSPRDEPEA